jgi:hypothetical protein
MVTLLTLIISTEFPLTHWYLPAFICSQRRICREGPLNMKLKRSVGREKDLPTENCCTSSFSYGDYGGLGCVQNVKRPDSCVLHEPGRDLL